MQKLPSLLVIASLGIICACSKTNSRTVQTDPVGIWQFVYAKGGFSGSDSIPADPAGVKTLWFHTNRTYAVKINDVATVQGYYDIRTDTTIFSEEPLQVVQFKQDSQTLDQIIEIKGDTLRLTDTHVEPYTSVYLKIQPQAY